MIGKDDQEEVSYTVNDRRKFNPDGSLREGFESVPEPKSKEPTPVYEPDAKTVEQYDSAAVNENIETTPQPANVSESVSAAAADEISDEDDEDFPGADDPASFVNFLSTLATNAAAALGAMPHPVTGQRSLDLETGKYWIDVLSMLKEKTKNNLHEKEARLFDGLLGDLQMQYVQISRMAEERLKQQAAQKFSGNDILGRK